jgi:hypothetical protein
MLSAGYRPARAAREGHDEGRRPSREIKKERSDALALLDMACTELVNLVTTSTVSDI